MEFLMTFSECIAHFWGSTPICYFSRHHYKLINQWVVSNYNRFYLECLIAWPPTLVPHLLMNMIILANYLVHQFFLVKLQFLVVTPHQCPYPLPACCIPMISLLKSQLLLVRLSIPTGWGPVFDSVPLPKKKWLNSMVYGRCNEL